MSPLETFCTKSQNLFSGEKKRKYFNMLSAENITQNARRKTLKYQLQK